MSFDDLGSGDLEALYLAWHDAVCSPRWRLCGESPSPRLFHNLVHEDLAGQRVVRDGSGRAAGLLQICEVEPTSGVGFLAFMLHRSVAPAAATATAFAEEARRALQLRKLVVHVDADILGGVGDLVACFHPAGRLRGHSRRSSDRYLDRMVYETWVDGRREEVGFPSKEGS